MNPCKGCKRREVGCHGRCDDYSEFRKSLDEEKKSRVEDQCIREYYIARQKRLQKFYHRDKDHKK